MTTQPDALRLDSLTHQDHCRWWRHGDMCDCGAESDARYEARIAALESALGMAVEALEGVASAMPFPVAREALATARQTLGGKHD